MANSTRARNPDLAAGLLNPKSVLRCASEEPNTSVQVAMSGDIKQFSVAMEALAKNCLEHFLMKTSTAKRDDGAGKVPAAKDSDKRDEPNVANKDAMEMCSVEGQHEMVQSTVSLAIYSVV